MAIKADCSQFIVGQIIGRQSSLPGAVHVAKMKSSKQQIIERLLAVKKYNLTDIEDDTDVMERIQHEVAALKQLDHPNILSCWTSLVTRDEIWVVTSLVEYGSVRDLMSHQMFSQGLPEILICLILRDLCHGLEYLHGQGVVHRAVRASHVLVSDSGAMLAGLRYSTGLQATGEGKTNLYSYPVHGVSSNLPWLAPEILQQNLLGYNESSDIYSLGVTVCEMANGVVPFSDLQPTLMMVEKLHGVTPSLTKQNYSSHLHQLVTVCCSLDCQMRPTARDLLSHPFIKQIKKSNSTLASLLTGVNKIQLNQSSEKASTKNALDQSSVINWIF